MKSPLKKIFFFTFLYISWQTTSAQLIITPNTSAQALAQQLVGTGVTISNASFTGTFEMSAFFKNLGGNNINIDSGIVLTSGRAKTINGGNGVNGNGTTQAQNIHANNRWNLPGDPDLANAIGSPVNGLHDACVLEFDFVPLGDSIKFNYIFSSEEYVPAFVCKFNDAFAFFISGPGITGLKNIALIPNTTIPVSIFNVNNVPGGTCPNNIAYYVENRTNVFLTHDGHTKVLTASEAVQPCQTYHLKLVISDVGDSEFDSGVFLQGRSLNSNAISLTNLTQTDPTTGTFFLAEGCTSGAFQVKRPRKEPFPLVVNLLYAGTATYGVDYLPLPASVTIPANDSIITVYVIPVIDNTPEGIETLKIFALAGCATGNPSDSTLIQIRDYDILSLTPDTAFICKGSSLQLIASPGYTIYQWMADPTLSSSTISNPVATPVNSTTTYICTATLGTCNARDSVFLRWKDLEFLSKTDVNCRNGATGQIKVAAGPEWLHPLQFSLNGITWQSDSTFNNLPAGNYWVKAKDADCIDSVSVIISQAFPDLVISNVATTPAGCSGTADGTITVTVAGGNNSYNYSVDGINFQTNNTLNVTAGNYTITVRDGNSCMVSQNVIISLNDTVTVDAGADITICEGTSHLISAVANGAVFSWTPATGLNNTSILNPIASPATTTTYYLTATSGICTKKDSVKIIIRPAPVADAGPDQEVCYGRIYQLNGSGGVSYQWSPSTNFISSTTVQNPEVKAFSNFTYSLMVTDVFNCKSIINDLVFIKVTPSVNIFAGNDTIAAINQPIQLNVKELSNAGVTRYTWTPANLLNNSSIASPIANLTSDQRFIVTGITPAGCQGSDDIFIKVYKGPDIYVPSGFTPNQDGLNEILAPVPVGIKEFKFFRIFNRWGQLVFFTQDPKHGWNGKINNIIQPTGTYVWHVQAIDFKGNLITRKGTVTLIR